MIVSATCFTLTGLGVIVWRVAEGHEGRLLSADLDPRSGWVVPPDRGADEVASMLRACGERTREVLASPVVEHGGSWIVMTSPGPTPSDASTAENRSTSSRRNR